MAYLVILLKRLQHVHNSAPRTFLNLPRRKPVRRHLKSLGWLPIPERTEFKVACLTYRCLNGLAPVHLSKLISPYTPERDLRSAGKNFIARDGDDSSYLICHELLAIWYHLQHQSPDISQNKFIATLKEVSEEASRVSLIFFYYNPFLNFYSKTK